MSRYEPKFGRVLIERENQEKIGSIIVPNAKAYAKCEGKIVALGETAGWTESYVDGELKPVQTLSLGDQVIFGKHSGAWLDATYSNGKENDDGKLFICQDQDILCVIKGAI